MGYLIAYLLLAVVVDLLLELVDPEGTRKNYIWINRRLWSDSLFDCGSRVVSTITPLPRQSHQVRPNRYRP